MVKIGLGLATKEKVGSDPRRGNGYVPVMVSDHGPSVVERYVCAVSGFIPETLHVQTSVLFKLRPPGVE